MTVINLLVVVVFLILYAVYQLAPRSFARVTTVRNAAPARRIESEEVDEVVVAVPDVLPSLERERREVGILALVSIGAGILYYLPFILRLPSFGGIPFQGGSMDRVYGMWDGPLWITASATLWDPNPHNPLYGWIGQAPSTYAERFPLFPLLVHALSPVLGYWKGGLFVNILTSTGVTLLLYVFVRRFGQRALNSEPIWSTAFWVALVSIFWPPRGFLYRYVLMSEPLFILGILGAAYFYKARRYTLCGLLGMVAVAARPNGFLVVAVFGLLAVVRIAAAPRAQHIVTAFRMVGLALMPLTLVAIFAWHQRLFGDPLASIHSSAFVQPQATLYPSLAFFGIGEEGVPYLFVLVLAGIIELVRRRHADLALLCTAFYIPSILVSVDVARYLLPVMPFAFGLAGERILASKAVRIALLLSVPLIYTYAWETMLNPGYQAPFGPLRALLP